MIRLASCALATSASLAANVDAGSAGIVVRAWAMVPLGSLTARPMRLDPGSTARILNATERL
jgi:hypothetical protein